MIAGLAITALLAASAARAGGPLHFGPFAQSYSFIGFNCNGFDIQIEGAGTDSFTVFLDDKLCIRNFCN